MGFRLISAKRVIFLLRFSFFLKQFGPSGLDVKKTSVAGESNIQRKKKKSLTVLKRRTGPSFIYCLLFFFCFFHDQFYSFPNKVFFPLFLVCASFSSLISPLPYLFFFFFLGFSMHEKLFSSNLFR